tara:strand:- start:1520 stop:2305 length:786 start_codon:yes stop_codon:yes gene_type:complete
MSITEDGEYGKKQIDTLEMIWGEGYLSPGGASEIDLILNNKSLKNKKILDIGCGCGSAAFHFIKNYSPKYILGVDVEEKVIKRANELKSNVLEKNKVEFKVIKPGVLPFDNISFDVIFSKDTFLHISDKETLVNDLYRVLKPGGFLCVGDWMRIDDDHPSKLMQEYIKLEGLSMNMCSLQRYGNALNSSGFKNIKLTDRNKWYLNLAKKELNDLSTIYKEQLIKILGIEDAEGTIKIWKKMIEVLEKGEHRPGHFYAEKPI